MFVAQETFDAAKKAMKRNMTKSTQQLADELAIKVTDFFVCDCFSCKPFNIANVLEKIPLLELLEVARAAKVLKDSLGSGQEDRASQSMTIALTNLQKKFEL